MYPAISLVNKFSLITYYVLENVLDAACIMVSKVRIVLILMENLQTSGNDLNLQPWYNDSADWIGLLIVYFVFWWQNNFVLLHLHPCHSLTTLGSIYPRPFVFYISKPTTSHTFPLSYWEKESVSQSCLILYDPMDYTVQGILQARILDWVAVPSPGDLPDSGIKPRSLTLQGDFFTIWATREALVCLLTE